MNKIEIHQEEWPAGTEMARRDFAIVTGVKQYDPPYWFVDKETNKEYKGIYGCIGWPGAVMNERDSEQPPGYAAVIGVQREDERFHLLEEVDALSPKLLIDKCLRMRTRWGFKVHPSLLQVFIGDHLRFELIVAQFNSMMISQRGKGSVGEAFIVSPPDEQENPKHWDIYFRQLQYVVAPEVKLLILGKIGTLLRNQLTEFKRDNPAVLAVGGLMHTLLGRTPWKTRTEDAVWIMPEL
uniref:Uncharacterized protein n=1 Tax=viral metagenome TaxID=1070528 RepID=A0A6M3LHZ5_9ZZZZ